MPIELDEGGNYPPPLYLRNIGDDVVLIIIDKAEVPWTDPSTGTQRVGKNGKPRTQEVFTVLVEDARRAVNSDNEPVATGDVYSLYIGGGKRASRIDAYKKLKRRVRVGDVWLVTFDHEEPASSPGLNPRKVWTFGVRDGKPDEVDRAEALHHERKQAIDLEPNVKYAGATYGDEEPF